MEIPKNELEYIKTTIEWLRDNTELIDHNRTQQETIYNATQNSLDCLSRALANDHTSEKDLRVCEVIASAWVSVKERLPEELSFIKPQTNGNTLVFYGMYLIYGNYHNESKSEGFHVSAYKPTSVCWYFTAPTNFTITHWMPLPTAPK